MREPAAPVEDASAIDRSEGDGAGLADRYRSVRAMTSRLVEPLSAEDCQVQPMPDASPIKWHLAHTTWFFETFLLVPARRDTASIIRRSVICSTPITTRSGPGPLGRSAA